LQISQKPSASEWQSKGRGFESHPLHCKVPNHSVTWASFTKQHILVLVERRWRSETIGSQPQVWRRTGH